MAHVELDAGAAPADVGDEWIVEGVQLWDVERWLAAADVVVWLDLPPRACVRRIVTRHIRLSVAGRNPHPGLRRLLGFVRRQRAYHSDAAREPRGPRDWTALTRAQTATTLAPHLAKVVHVRTSADLRRWLSDRSPG